MRSARRCSSRAARSASSIDSIDSRIVAPVERPDLGMREQLQPVEFAARELIVRAAVSPVLVRVRAVVVRIEERRLHHIRRRRGSARACTRGRGCATRRPGRSGRRGRRGGRRRGARRGGRARAAVRSRARRRSTRGCRTPSASSGTRSTTRLRRLRPRRLRSQRRARDRRHAAGSTARPRAAGRSRRSGNRLLWRRATARVVAEREVAAHRSYSTSTSSSVAAASARSSASRFVLPVAIT